MEKENNKIKLKKKWKIIITIILCMCILLCWAMFISTKGIIVKEYKVVNKDLPESFYGLKIVHFSDLHYGRTIKEKELKELVKNINLTKPDIVIFTGDLVDRDVKLTNSMNKILIKYLSNIESIYGKYYITGNHDKYFDSYDETMEDSDFINLNDAYDTIYSEKLETIFIAGMNCYITKTPSLKNVDEYIENNEIPKFKIFAMHVPDNMKYVKNYDFDLVLAGHSHGGQVRLPFVGAIIKPVGAKTYYDEYYKVNNTDLYISSGLGTSTFNIRFFNKPSFNLYRVVNK